jgi:hypothetical protein
MSIATKHRRRLKHNTPKGVQITPNGASYKHLTPTGSADMTRLTLYRPLCKLALFQIMAISILDRLA